MTREVATNFYTPFYTPKVLTFQTGERQGSVLICIKLHQKPETKKQAWNFSMLDEFDKPLERDDAEGHGEDAEVPILPKSAEVRANNHNPASGTKSAQRHIGPALNWVSRLRLRAWSVFSSSSFWTAFATLVIAGATIKYTLYAHRQWDTMRGQLDEMVNQSRPWIKITTVELRPGIAPIKTLMFHWPLTGAEVPPILQVKVSLLNVGHSPAQNVEAVPEFFSTDSTANIGTTS